VTTRLTDHNDHRAWISLRLPNTRRTPLSNFVNPLIFLHDLALSLANGMPCYPTCYVIPYYLLRRGRRKTEAGPPKKTKLKKKRVNKTMRFGIPKNLSFSFSVKCTWEGSNNQFMQQKKKKKLRQNVESTDAHRTKANGKERKGRIFASI